MQNMSAIELVRKTIPSEVFSYTELMFALREYKKPRDAVSVLLASGRIIRIKKGLYVFGNDWRRNDISHEYISNLIYGPSALSLDYALSFYNLIPEFSQSYTSICSGRSKRFETPLGNFFYYGSTEKRFSIQLTIRKTNSGQFIITTPCKALADKVWTDNRFKPVSLKSYEEYFFSDLRIDKDILHSVIDITALDEIAQTYQTRKITWMTEFLKKWEGM